MPKLRNRLPSYRLHKASGQAVVTLAGRDIYLGTHNTDESRERYQQVLAEWLSGGSRAQPQRNGAEPGARHGSLSINELFLLYWEFVNGYYRKHGTPTSEVASVRRALRRLLELYGRSPASDFGPLSLKTYREQLIQQGLTRGVINNHVGRAKRFFRWAAENELVPAQVYHSLQTVVGLRRGRSAARESDPIRPVSDALVDGALAHVSRHVAAMIQLQRLTGMRPCEVTIMRGRDVDFSGRLWVYRPQSHKTEHHGRERIICLGPRAQEVLRPFLLEDRSKYLFSPRLAMAEQRRLRRVRRKTPRYARQRLRRHRRTPRKEPGEHYTTGSYEHAIIRGCDKAFPPPSGLSGEEAKRWRKQHRWSPNQLRHNAATQLRKEFGLEAARVVLGHSSAAVTEVYAERDVGLAAEIMLRVG